MKEYLFDVKLFATIRIKAESEAGAREIIDDLQAATVVFDGEITGEGSTDGEADLIEVDGEPV